MFSEETIHNLDYRGALPPCFNNPFNYTPHEVCRCAVGELLPCVENLMKNVNEGKMFGVLIVQDENNQLAYLAAFSGQIGDKSVIPGFVPPIFDIMETNGYFKVHEAEISTINRKILALENDTETVAAESRFRSLQKCAETEFRTSKACLAHEKRKRDELRKGNLTDDENKKLVRESQFQKAEHKRLQQRWTGILREAEEAVNVYRERIQQLKDQRKAMSEDLQKWIFSQYLISNHKGEKSNIQNIFIKYTGHLPPAGTGDCCEPKLLQFAFNNRLKPIQMAMFWWGGSPAGEIRHHLKYYPACSGKCKPLLEFMLPKTVFENISDVEKNGIEILYEDSDLWVVNKPAKTLSVPGRRCKESVLSCLKEKCEGNVEPLVVHRLDMDTSGVMIVAKNHRTRAALQRQFLTHDVQKTYYAVLSGDPLRVGVEGTISLPLSADLLHRPFQKVDLEKGKKAITKYRAVGEHFVELQPLTGRTHQLRVHCAHPQGLNRPIVGDNLYGNTGDDLKLFATRIEFTHPTTGERMAFEIL